MLIIEVIVIKVAWTLLAPPQSTTINTNLASRQLIDLRNKIISSCRRERNLADR